MFYYTTRRRGKQEKKPAVAADGYKKTKGVDNCARVAYNYSNMLKNANERAKKGAAVSAAGIACNIALAALKITVGAIFGMVSVIADGFNNVSDCGSSAVSLASFRISEKPADKEHPYGHRRAEYLAAMITGFIVLFLAVELARESVVKIIDGSGVEANYIVYAALAASVAVKAALFGFYRHYAKKLQSDVLKAAATDSACDCIATLTVIAGVVIGEYTSFPADGAAGVAVALFIAWQGIAILRDASSKLLGQAPDKELVDGIRGLIAENPDVLGMHDLRIYCYGRDVNFATVHVEMDSNIPAMQAHTVLDGIERKIFEKFNVAVTAHLDPVDLKDGEAFDVERKIIRALEGVADGLEIHDFRLERGERTKVVFDAGVPYGCKSDDEKLLKAIDEAVKSVGDFDVSVNIERE